MERKNLNFRVGVFVLGGAALFVALAIVAVGSSLGRDTARYRIHFKESIKGMVRGSPVNFQGVAIGTVADMRFHQGRTEVTIEVDPNAAPIQSTTTAALDRAWVTGQVTIELEGWQPGGQPLSQWGVIEASLSTTAVVMRSLPEVLERVTQILEEVGKVAAKANQKIDRVLSPDNLERIAGILRESEQTLMSLNRKTLPAITRGVEGIEPLGPEAQKTLEGVRAVAASFEDVVRDPAVKGLLKEGTELVGVLRDELPKLLRVGGELELFLRGNRREFGRAMTNLKLAAREIESLARLLQAAPKALVWGEAARRQDVRSIKMPAMPPPTPVGGKR